MLPRPPRGPFTLKIETRLDPAANTKLMGLYRSGSAYCTQCEAEGFRRITYFLDRPDVLSTYRVRLEADRAEAPVLLANGNLENFGEVGRPGASLGDLDRPAQEALLPVRAGGGRARAYFRFVRHGVRPKGRARDLRGAGREERAHYAMDSLKRSMAWDERAYGREYDLDVFNIVAVSDFNMGAMENKGLNVFNDKYVLASPQTATDEDYAGIEGVIAHEYFHNWTGNRITCRDWFQLCLKEGLTVFRDQEFSADMRSAPVKRIAEVRVLRAAQFPEDAGPLAHNVRPEVYHEINNFYTATVYQKGAEIIRMLKRLIGAEAFRAGMDLYFQRYDGTAATVEDFIACFADVSGRDLGRFMRWYGQAGTPKLTVRGATTRRSGPIASKSSSRSRRRPARRQAADDDAARARPCRSAGRRHAPDFSRRVPRASSRRACSSSRTPSGRSCFTTCRGGRRFPSCAAFPRRSGSTTTSPRTISSSSRGATATTSTAGRRCKVWRRACCCAASRRSGAAGRPSATPGSIAAFGALIEDARAGRIDPAFAALAMTLPSEADIAREIGEDVDPDAIYAARKTLRAHSAARTATRSSGCTGSSPIPAPFSPDAAAAGRRALRNGALALFVDGNVIDGLALAHGQLREADNMTERLSALATIALKPSSTREHTLDAFGRRYAMEPLILDKWFALQAQIPERETLERVRTLMTHRGFSMSNPNRVRALIGGFSANHTQFNRADGAGFALLEEVVVTLDPTNPQIAARLLTAMRSWRSLEIARRRQAEAMLRRIAAQPTLSPDVRDIVTRSLG